MCRKRFKMGREQIGICKLFHQVATRSHNIKSTQSINCVRMLFGHAQTANRLVSETNKSRKQSKEKKNVSSTKICHPANIALRRTETVH